MNTSIGTNEAVIKNLEDAGCNKQLIEKIMALYCQKEYDNQLCLLTKHRCTVLEKIHAAQKQLDCLDYLVYKIRKISDDE